MIDSGINLAAQNNNNVVLLLYAGWSLLSVEQSGRNVEFDSGESVLGEQSVSSIIRVDVGRCSLIKGGSLVA